MDSESPRRSAAQETHQSWIERLARPPSIDGLHPIAARFVYSLRLVALHQQAGRDPVPELTQRLGSISGAISALGLAETIAYAWPEAVQLRRFCCQRLSHDETTIGRIVGAAWEGDRCAFDAELCGLVRVDRIERLWDDALDFVQADARPRSGGVFL